MYSVTVCVVLVFVSNVGSFVLSRTRRDLEQNIFDFYGPPSVPRPMHPHPHHVTLKPDHHAKRKHVEEPEEHIPQGLLDNIFGSPVNNSKPNAESSAPHLTIKPDHAMKKRVEEPKVHIPQGVLDNIFGAPVKKSKPDAKSSVPHFYSAVIDNVEHTMRREEKDSPRRHNTDIGDDEQVRKDAEQYFGTPAPEAMIATENSTATNETVSVDYGNRFLSETLLRTQWIQNREESEKNENHVEKPQARSPPHPELPQREQSGPLDPGNDRSLLGPFEHSHEPFPLDSTSLETEGLEPRYVPVDSRSMKPTLESEQHILKPTSMTNASGKNFVSNSLVLVLLYFWLESLICI